MVLKPCSGVGQLIAANKRVRSNCRLLGAPMAWMRRVFRLPASETQLGLTLAMCIFSMSLMAIALIWQAQVIANQNAVIHMMETRLGG
jgi:hypothetical protein